MTDDLSVCPTCGALPCDWTDPPTAKAALAMTAARECVDQVEGVVTDAIRQQLDELGLVDPDWAGEPEDAATIARAVLAALSTRSQSPDVEAMLEALRQIANNNWRDQSRAKFVARKALGDAQ